MVTPTGVNSMQRSLASLAFIILSLSPVDALVPWQGTWLPADGRVRGVALVLHGLNLQPEKMDELSRVLCRAGIEVLRVSLSGHGFGNLREVTAASWLEQTGEAYRAAAREAHRLRVPLFFVGYSLGGLLGETLLATSSGSARPRFNRAVLLAPAIALRPAVYLVRILCVLGRGFTLPSANLPAYRAHSGTPIAAYEALLRLVSMLRSERYRGTNHPTMVFVRNDDELVSPNGIRRLVRKYELSDWSISVIPNRGPPGYPRHLIIDEASLGAVEWQRLASTLLRFLLGPPTGGPTAAQRDRPE